MNAALRSYVKDDQRNWDIYLNNVNFALGNSSHQTTGETPYKLIFGQSMLTHGKDYELIRNLKLLEESDVQIQRVDKFILLRDSIQEKMRKAYAKNERHYKLRARKRNLYIGQKVIRRNFVQSSAQKKFCAKLALTGVCAKVLKKIGNNYYELKDTETG
ncbi:uncharacterized protein LOC142224971 [Haematobia irritans]|uniref:uncharacterized protein LOC142224971 n=1 Tax=Haematobia irritans TaxID=7368 RepID=UPI003F4FCEA7